MRRGHLVLGLALAGLSGVLFARALIYQPRLAGWLGAGVVAVSIVLVISAVWRGGPG